MAPLVFLARPAPAGIVAPQLSGTGFATGARGGANRRDASRLRCSVAARLAIAIELARSAFHDPAHHRLRRWRRRVARRRLDVKDHRHDRALDALTKLVEHLERFVLVLDERIALPEARRPTPSRKCSICVRYSIHCRSIVCSITLFSTSGITSTPNRPTCTFYAYAALFF